MTGMITVTIWHNVTRDDAGRHTGPPGDQMVKVFTYKAELRGRTPEEIAEHAFCRFQRRRAGQRGRGPGPAVPAAAPAITVLPRKAVVLPRSCCIHHSVVLPDQGQPEVDRVVPRRMVPPATCWVGGVVPDCTGSTPHRGLQWQGTRCGSEPAEEGRHPARCASSAGLLTVRDDQGRAVPGARRPARQGRPACLAAHRAVRLGRRGYRPEAAHAGRDSCPAR